MGCTCGLARSVWLAGVIPAWVDVSRAPSIECGRVSIGYDSRSDTLKRTQKDDEDEWPVVGPAAMNGISSEIL